MSTQRAADCMVRVVPAKMVRKVSGKKRSRSFVKETVGQTGVVSMTERSAVKNLLSYAESQRRVMKQFCEPILVDTEMCYSSYVKMECELLLAKQEVQLLQVLGNLNSLFRSVPIFSLCVGRRRLIDVAHSKRSKNTVLWSPEVAKCFGKLMATIGHSIRECKEMSTRFVSARSFSAQVKASPPIAKKMRANVVDKSEEKRAAMQLLKLSPTLQAMPAPSES